MITLSKEQVKKLHQMQIAATGGSDGLRDEGLLESALHSAFQTFEGDDLYPTAIAKIARIAYNLTANHPFVDGNKRIGTYVMLVLLELNQIPIDFSDDDIIRIGLDVANGKMDDSALLNFLLDKMDD